MALKGGKPRSIKALKQTLKRGGGAQFLKRIPEAGITVRFLTEPTEWFTFFEHFDDNAEPKYYPCQDHDCAGCMSDDPDVRKTSKRVLTNALDVGEGNVIPLVLQATVANGLVKKYERYNTLLDRDYELAKEGKGFDTEFDIDAQPPSSMRLKQYDLMDLEATLMSQLTGVDDEDDDDEDEVPPQANGRRRVIAKKVIDPRYRPAAPVAAKKVPAKAAAPVKAAPKKLPVPKAAPRKLAKRGEGFADDPPF